jgi:uncharacterized protein YigE (DUF2233 family)
MRALLVSLLLLTACNRSEPSLAAQSACRGEIFEDVRFTVCDPGKGKIELVAAGPDEQAIRRLADLELELGPRASRLAFAMNAGMYDDDGRPIGLAIVDGKQKHAVNRREGGGNFHLMPNGCSRYIAMDARRSCGLRRGSLQRPSNSRRSPARCW